MLGSVSDFSLRESHSSVCIVRSTGNKIDANQTKFMFATDGSHAAASAFVLLVTMYEGGEVELPSLFCMCVWGGWGHVRDECMSPPPAPARPRRLVRPKDILTVVQVCTSDSTQAQENIRAYQQFMDEREVIGACYVSEINRGQMSIPTGILSAAHEHDADILVMGISGYR